MPPPTPSPARQNVPRPTSYSVTNWATQVANTSPLPAAHTQTSQNGLQPVQRQTVAARPPDRIQKKRQSNQKRPALSKVDSKRKAVVDKTIEFYNNYLIARDPMGLLPTERYGTEAM